MPVIIWRISSEKIIQTIEPLGKLQNSSFRLKTCRNDGVLQVPLSITLGFLLNLSISIEAWAETTESPDADYKKAGTIFLEVPASNARACTLYHMAGFNEQEHIVISVFSIANLSIVVPDYLFSVFKLPALPEVMAMKKSNLILIVFFLIIVSCKDPIRNEWHESIVLEEFIYQIKDAQTPQVHAPSIAESGGIIVSAWFGGTEEKNDDVSIWVSRKVEGEWSVPLEVANGVQKDGNRYPSWNPVLFKPENKPLILFYKVGPNPREWWGLYITSEDDGLSWSEPIKLPDEIYGPIKNKSVQLSNGDILSPASTEHDGWKIQIERSTDSGKTWKSTGDLNDPEEFGAIQPTILIHSNDTLQILCRTKNSVISESWSHDSGYTWSKMIATDLPNPNSGIDAVSLIDKRYLLVYNPTDKNWGKRVPLSVAVSPDGKHWKEFIELESVTELHAADKEEYSYPSIIQTSDGLVHIVYTWNRKTVKHVVLDPAKIDGN